MTRKIKTQGQKVAQRQRWDEAAKAGIAKFEASQTDRLADLRKLMGSEFAELMGEE